VTINGVTVNYDVTTQSIDQIFANINAAVQAAGDSSFNIGFKSGTDTVQITDGNNPISLGSAADKGNLLQVLRLDQAQVQNGATSGSVTATAGVGGINQALEFDSTNSAGTATNAGYVTPVTSGFFTINGVQISVDAANDNLHSVLQRINASSAGVNATYNSATGQITLTNKATGAQSIVLGSSSDTSNFLSATGLTAASGAATTIGAQAALTFQDASGASHTVYSNSNNVTTAIPGVQINLLANSTAPFQITVGQDTTQLVSAVNSFVSAYNAAITEINLSTAPPVVLQGGAGSSIGASASNVGGGILYGNANVESVKDELVNMVSAYNPNNPDASSLAAIGLTLTSSFAELTASGSGSSSNPNSVTTTTMSGTDGQLQPLNVAALQSALAADPSAVQTLFNGSSGLVTQMGTYLTNVTGLPTQTQSGMLGSIPATSLLQGFENSNNSDVDSIKQQIKQIQDNANQQADALRAEFVQTESTLAGYQALQQQLGSFLNGSSGG
jgi:flagellar hook-associated protein 2